MTQRLRLASIVKVPFLAQPLVMNQMSNPQLLQWSQQGEVLAKLFYNSSTPVAAKPLKLYYIFIPCRKSPMPAEASDVDMLSSGDIKLAVQLKKSRPLTDQEKYHMLTKHFVPKPSYKFPSIPFGKQNRSFQHSWLTHYNGLVYSELDEGAYCKYCVLFGQAGQTVSDFGGTLITLSLTNLKKASEKLRDHFEGNTSTTAKKYHLAAVEKAELFKATMEQRIVPVDQQLSYARAETIRKNREKIKSIAQTIIFCGRQGIALRGHRDDWKHLAETPHANPGNFIALLRFRAESGDQVLADHLGTAPNNALYTSKTIQNEIIGICGSIIRSAILGRVQNAVHYSLLADEAADISNKEQLAVCLRYLDVASCKIDERFLAFSECDTGVSGEAIANRLLGLLESWQLPASNMVGQAYDGAGSMAGKHKGAASRISEQHPKATYTHCAAHVLNLCVVKCCSILEVRNAMDTADCICRFFNNSPKRQSALEEFIGKHLQGEKRRKLLSVCKTRWVERHEAFEVFIDLYKVIVSCLEAIKDSTDWNRESRNDAQSYFLSLSSFSLIVALVVTKEVLGYTKGLSVKLQGRYVDIVKAHKDVNLVLDTLKDARRNIDPFHNRIYATALSIASDVNVEESRPRTTVRQEHRGNVPSSSTSEYYKRILTIPILDHLIAEVSERFSSRITMTLAQVMLLLPSHVTAATLVASDIEDLLSTYEDDLPSPSTIETEIHLWNTKWKDNPTAHSLDTPLKAVTSTDRDFFPNIRKLLEIACTLPVSSAECERSVSRLRYLKTYLRSTTTEDRLNGLAMLYVHRDIPCPIQTVVDEFARAQPRRLELSNPFFETEV